MSDGGLVTDSPVASGAGFRCVEGGPEGGGDPDSTAPSEAIRHALTIEVGRVFTTIMKRHDKYGPNNIANAPGGAINGIMVRLHDKMSRLQFGLDNHEDESVVDAFTDLAGYSIIALMVLHGRWPQ